MAEEGVTKGLSRAEFFKRASQQEFVKKRKAKIKKEQTEEEFFTPERLEGSRTSYLEPSQIKPVEEKGKVIGYESPQEQKSVLLPQEQTKERFARTIKERQAISAKQRFEKEQAKVKTVKKAISTTLKGAGQELKSQFELIKTGTGYALSTLRREKRLTPDSFRQRNIFLGIKEAKKTYKDESNYNLRKEKAQQFFKSWGKSIIEDKPPFYTGYKQFSQEFVKTPFYKPQESLRFVSKKSRELKTKVKEKAQQPELYIALGGLGVQVAEAYVVAKAPKVIKKIGSIPEEFAYSRRVKAGKKFFAEPPSYYFENVDDIIYVTQRPSYVSPVKDLPVGRRATLSKFTPQTTLKGGLVSQEKIKWLRAEIPPRKLFGQDIFIKKTEVIDKSVSLWDFSKEGKLVKGGVGTQEGYLKYLKTTQKTSLDDLVTIPKRTKKTFTYTEFADDLVKTKTPSKEIALPTSTRTEQVLLKEPPKPTVLPKTSSAYDYTKYDKIVFETIPKKSNLGVAAVTQPSVFKASKVSFGLVIKPTTRQVIKTQQKPIVKQLPLFEQRTKVLTKPTTRQVIKTQQEPLFKQTPLYEQRTRLLSPLVTKQRITQERSLPQKSILKRSITPFDPITIKEPEPFSRFKFEFKPQKDILLTKKEPKSVKFKTKYTPSVEAAAFSIYGKPTKAATISGLGLRPLVR